MCFAKNLTVMCLVGSPVEINNRVPANQARFPRLLVIERFCVESSNERSDRAALDRI